MKIIKQAKGITLIALILTIVILLILAVVTIRSIQGEGIIAKAMKAREKYEGAADEEQGMLDKYLKDIEGITSGTSQGGSEEENLGETSSGDNSNTEDNLTQDGNSSENNSNEEDNSSPNEEDNSEVSKEPISTKESYVGYYADVDANGIVDGIIYADLAVGGSGEWTNPDMFCADGTYTINIKENLNNYYISQKSYETNGFGLKSVIAPIDAVEENDRFYVMAVKDFDNGTKYYWYGAAYGNMNDYKEITSGDFGTGKTNTKTMIEKWNNKVYGAQDTHVIYKDMWGRIQTKVEEGWFVPSRGEWAAFAKELGITKENYSTYGLGQWYWSSSQNDDASAYNAFFGGGCMGAVNINSVDYVRLSTTF